jgi:glycosyltransferase A (GT-A) superfamily protein (DUF2064 family)
VRVAIGVMARAPLPGRCKTRLLAAHEGGWVAGLYAAMLRDTLDGLQMIPAADYVVFVAPVAPAPGEEADVDARSRTALDVLARHVPAPWTLALQGEDALPERVLAALGALVARGGGGGEETCAVLVGSDAPSFPTDPLAEALASMAPGRDPALTVAGPTESGGLYAIATTKVEPRLLRDLAWGTPALVETMRARSRELGLPLRELPRWPQVREPSDVLALLDELRRHPDRAPRTAQFLATHA